MIAIEAPHATEQNREEEYTLLWTQYMLIDAEQIVQTDEPPYVTQRTLDEWKLGSLYSRRRANAVSRSGEAELE
jgi:hypothetical protein